MSTTPIDPIPSQAAPQDDPARTMPLALLAEKIKADAKVNQAQGRLEETQEFARQIGESVGQPAPTSPNQPAAPGAPNAPYRMTKGQDGSLSVELETGEIFKGTPDEVISKLAKSKVDTTVWSRDLKTQLTALQGQQFTPQSQAPPWQAAIEAEEQQLQNFILDQQAKALGLHDGAEYIATAQQLLRSSQEAHKRRA